MLEVLQIIAYYDEVHFFRMTDTVIIEYFIAVLNGKRYFCICTFIKNNKILCFL